MTAYAPEPNVVCWLLADFSASGVECPLMATSGHRRRLSKPNQADLYEYTSWDAPLIQLPREGGRASIPLNVLGGACPTCPVRSPPRHASDLSYVV